MYEVLLGIFLVVALLLIGVILIQQGKGADMGASFGAGASNTVFGASGSGNFLTKSTAVLVILFFAVALAINYMVSHRDRSVEQKDEIFSAEQDGAVPAEASLAAPVNTGSELPTAEIPAAETPVTEVPAAEIPAAAGENENSEVPKP